MLIRSVVLWNAPLLVEFRNCNVKKPRRANRSNFITILRKYTYLSEINDSYIDSLFQLMDSKGEKAVHYLVFYEYYITYANRNRRNIRMDEYAYRQ
jgi:hypothetical protein